MELPTDLSNLNRFVAKLAALEKNVEPMRLKTKDLASDNEQLRLAYENEKSCLASENEQLRLENEKLRLENAELRRSLGIASTNSLEPPGSVG
jgi:regulator of replication initiation timing